MCHFSWLVCYCVPFVFTENRCFCSWFNVYHGRQRCEKKKVVFFLVFFWRAHDLTALFSTSASLHGHYLCDIFLDWKITTFEKCEQKSKRMCSWAKYATNSWHIHLCFWQVFYCFHRSAYIFCSIFFSFFNCAQLKKALYFWICCQVPLFHVPSCWTIKSVDTQRQQKHLFIVSLNPKMLIEDESANKFRRKTLKEDNGAGGTTMAVLHWFTW